VTNELLLQGIRLFNDQKFFQSHETLEEAWMPERGPRRQFLQALIHLAVGLYHSQRDNPVGAVRQLHKGLKKLAAYVPSCEGIDTARLYREALALATNYLTHLTSRCILEVWKRTNLVFTVV
jgi:predicted metal-dependent hydrolase